MTMRLRVFFAIALVAGTAHLALAFGLMSAWTNAAITRDAEVRAQDWSQFAMAQFDRVDAVAAGDQIYPWEYRLLDELVAYSDVFRVKIYGPDGDLRMVSDAELADTLTLFTDRAMDDVMAREIAPMTIIRDGSAEPYLPETYSETIVPIVRDGRLVALMEVYIDQTAHVAVVRSAYWALGLVIGGLVLATFLAPAIWIAVLLWRYERANAALRQKELLAAEAEHARIDFIRTISHELRNPLNGILGSATLLREGALDVEDLQLVDVVEDCALTQRDFIEELLTVSEADAGALKLDIAPVSLHALMHKATQLGEVLAANKGLHFTLCLDAPDLMINTDAKRLRQIVTNLVTNAIRYTEEGAITVQVKLDMAAYGMIGRLKISVADTGIGIPSADTRRVFDKFVRLDSSAAQSPVGTGLGLAISRAIAHALNGDIFVESEPGEGSVFTVTLPIAFNASSKTAEQAA